MLIVAICWSYRTTHSIWTYFLLFRLYPVCGYNLYPLTGLLHVNVYKYCRGWPYCRNDRVSQLQKKRPHTLIRKRHSGSFEILCSMLSHVRWRYTFIMPIQRNDDINWKSNWYANCCDLMDLQNNAFNMNVLCAISIVPGLWVQFVPANRLTACKCIFLFLSITTQRYS